jgi:hypothetical protein
MISDYIARNEDEPAPSGDEAKQNKIFCRMLCESVKESIFAAALKESSICIEKSGPKRTRVISSGGLERCFDRAEVTGSSPVLPTL